MTVEELAPGLWRWTGYHPEWKQDVGCVSVETADGLVLVDPLVPPEDPGRFLAALDRDVERAGGLVHVLVTLHYHGRSTRELAGRYRGARVWAPARARAAIARRTGEPSDLFRPGDELAGGIRALATGRATEAAFWLPDHDALVFGDVVLGSDDGGARLCPPSWLPASTDLAAVRDALRPLLDLPVERLLVSHGEPVRSGGREALERALRA